MNVRSATKSLGLISWLRTRSTRRMKPFGLGSEVAFWERFPVLFCPGWWRHSVGRQDRRGMPVTLGRAMLPPAIKANANGSCQLFWWATLGYKDTQLHHLEDHRTTGHGSLTFRYWFFFSTRVKSFKLFSQSLPSWKMSAKLFRRMCFHLGSVGTVWEVCPTPAGNLLPGCKLNTQSALPKKQTWNKTIPSAPPTLWLYGHSALKRKWQPCEPTCRRIRGHHPSQCTLGVYSTLQCGPTQALKFTRMPSHSCIFWVSQASCHHFNWTKVSSIFGFVFVFLKYSINSNMKHASPGSGLQGKLFFYCLIWK